MKIIPPPTLSKEQHSRIELYRLAEQTARHERVSFGEILRKAVFALSQNPPENVESIVERSFDGEKGVRCPSFLLPDELAAWLDEFSFQHDISRNKAIRVAVDQLLNTQEVTSEPVIIQEIATE